MRKMLTGRSTVVAIVGLGLVVGGCGSSSSSTGSAATATAPAGLTKAQYLAQGNAICTKGQAAQQRAVAAYLKVLHVNPNKQPSKANFAKVAKAVLVPNIQAQITAVRALGAPSGDQQKVTVMLATAQQELDKLKKDPAPLETGNPFAAAGKLLHAYGLTDCAKGS